MREGFRFFRQWMANNPRQWRKRGNADLSVPPDFKYTLGHEVVPIYMRFLQEFGALNLLSVDEETPESGFACQLLTPWEIHKSFVEGIVCWNSPEFKWDFSYLMPFCQHTWTAYTYCFDMSFPGDNDLPVVMFDPTGGIPDADWKIAASFLYWLEIIVKFDVP